MNLLVTDIGHLVQVEERPGGPVRGDAMQSLPALTDAYLWVSDGRIAGYGTMPPPAGLLERAAAGAMKVIDAAGRFVFPAWVDAHTHLVFAATREGEFADRIRGLGYEEIARRGGGILNSAGRLAEASEDDLFDGAMERLAEITATGTGALEIKSGYGLSLESELKMLRVVKRLRAASGRLIRSTFLGAHAVPAAYAGNRMKYIDLVIREMLPRVADEGLADFADVFCERGYFSQDETVTILEAASRLGMQPKVHANQLSRSGGVQAGVATGAVSVDHLEFVGDEEIALLAESKTIPVLLPGAAFFLDMPYPPARAMIGAGLPVAAASDYNPGSCPSGSMPFMIALLCIQYRMTPEEAVHAATINAAHAMGAGDEVGSFAVGKRADFFIARPMPSLASIPYAFTRNRVDRMFVGGVEQAT